MDLNKISKEYVVRLPTVKIKKEDMTKTNMQFETLIYSAPTTTTVVQDDITQAAFGIYLSSVTKLVKGEISAKDLLIKMIEQNNKTVTEK